MSQAIVIESAGPAGSEWGVSYGGHNPEPNHYLACATREMAHSLCGRINSRPACPACGSRDVIRPAVAYRNFTCDPCGRDFT